jgi:acetoin utilization deacetylase AcuC-like enzyme
LIEDDFIWITKLITATANQYARGRIISTLEGGYHLDALASSATAHILAMTN